MSLVTSVERGHDSQVGCHCFGHIAGEETATARLPETHSWSQRWAREPCSPARDLILRYPWMPASGPGTKWLQESVFQLLPRCPPLLNALVELFPACQLSHLESFRLVLVCWGSSTWTLTLGDPIMTGTHPSPRDRHPSFCPCCDLPTVFPGGPNWLL